MIMVEDSSHHARAETSCWIQRAASVENANHLRDEEGESNADWCDESGFVLLLCKHEDSEDKFSRQDRFDEHALNQTCAACESCPDVELGREQTQNHSRGGNSTSNLGNEKAACSNDWKSTDENHAQSNSGVEQASGDTEEDPDIGHQGEAEDDGDV